VLHPDLKAACEAISDWCDRNGVAYDLVYDEDDTQGLLVFRRHKNRIPPLLNAVREHTSDLYLRQVQARAGTIILLSVSAINEAELANSLGDIIVTDEFALKVGRIFDGELTEEPAQPEQAQPPSLRERLLASAREMAESQYKSPTNVLRRGGALSQFKNSIVRGHGDGEQPPEGASEEAEPEAAIPTLDTATPEEESKLEYTSRLGDILSELAPPGGAQGLQGLGAEYQPGDLFQRFAQAMQVLGQQLHLGAPLQDLLKKQGISWKKSDDAQAVIFFVKNAATNAPQPIARIGYQTLSKPQDFQTQLMNMLDFAKGQAPGTEQQKYEEAQEAQKQMRELANQFAPPQQGKGASGAGAAPPAVAPTPAPAAAVPAKPAVPAGPAKSAVGPAKPAVGPAKPAAKPGLMAYSPKWGHR